ncbi:hypothetical protein DUI87_06114 [Hirundo rustica rustica]|uniref:Uncharacterized protein n=1 Tax=Hirundo rustica rustica TaxID=333673 RepID=A0A3M0KVZ1_HIRRU|nr:hypothetical protein DUI87_06114 [Hirundo rustica rustica]
MSKTVSSVLVVNKNGGDVGKDEARKPYKYDCLDSENVKPVSEIELKELEAITDVVATLGELVAIITPPCRSTWPLLYPRSLCADLRRFTCRLHEALKRHSVTFLRQRSVTPLGQAVAALRATPGATWADVRAAVKGWRKSVYELEDSWYWLVEDAANLLDYWKNKVTTEATTKATATAQAGDLQDESTSWETAGDNPVAAAQQPPVPPDKDKLDLMLDAHFARVDAAEKAMEEAMVATSQAGTATRRGQQVEVAVGLLGRLVVECDRADQLSWELHDQLDDMEAALEGKKEVPTDVPEALVVAVDKFQQLWEASSRQNKRHLLRRLEVIYHLLLSPYGSSGGPGGHSVAKSQEESEYANVWVTRPGGEVLLFPLNEGGRKKDRSKEEEALLIPPPYIPPQKPQIPDAPPMGPQEAGSNPEPPEEVQDP